MKSCLAKATCSWILAITYCRHNTKYSNLFNQIQRPDKCKLIQVRGNTVMLQTFARWFVNNGPRTMEIFCFRTFERMTIVVFLLVIVSFLINYLASWLEFSATLTWTPAGKDINEPTLEIFQIHAKAYFSTLESIRAKLFAASGNKSPFTWLTPYMLSSRYDTPGFTISQYINICVSQAFLRASSFEIKQARIFRDLKARRELTVGTIVGIICEIPAAIFEYRLLRSRFIAISKVPNQGENETKKQHELPCQCYWCWAKIGLSKLVETFTSKPDWIRNSGRDGVQPTVGSGC